MQKTLEQKISEALEKLGIKDVKVVVEYPADLTHGDFATNAALAAAKAAGMNPHELAEKIVVALGNIENVEKIDVAGPGFINFTLSRDYFSNVARSVGGDFGKSALFSGKRVVVEYGQPNPFKPFHIGHLMSISVGEAISRLFEFSGGDVSRFNYQGDIGPHVAKCLWGLKKEGGDPSNVADLGNAYVFGNSAYETDPIAKEEIDALNKKLYEGTSGVEDEYAKGRKASLEKFEEIYSLLGTAYDHYAFESETAPLGMDMVMDGLEKGIFEKSDDAIVYKGEKAGLHTRVFVTSKGTPTYETKEIGLAKLKYTIKPFDLNVTTVAVEQDAFFKVVRAALGELWPEMKDVYTHATFGMMQLSTGKMSSRKGNIVTGESLIEDMQAKVKEKMKDRDLGSDVEAVVDAVAVSAIKYDILKQTKGKNIIFDPERALSFEGDSGPYLQYSYVRAMSVLEKAQAHESSETPPELTPEFERLLPRFPAIVERAAEEYEPHYVTTYLTELASSFNSWYANGKIIGTEHEGYKIVLTKAFAQTMKNGLWLLGIEVPERM